MQFWDFEMVYYTIVRLIEVIYFIPYIIAFVYFGFHILLRLKLHKPDIFEWFYYSILFMIKMNGSKSKKVKYIALYYKFFPYFFQNRFPIRSYFNQPSKYGHSKRM